MDPNRTELIRKGWHMLAGLAALPLVAFTDLPYATLVALAVTFFVVAIELLHATFGIRVPFWSAQLARVRRPEEHFSWASIGFLLTLIALFWVTPRPVAVAAAGMLAFGDTFSSLGGRAFGHVRIPWNRRKSLEGSLAGLVGGFAGAFILVTWQRALDASDAAASSPTLAQVLAVVAIGSAFAMLAESLPRLEDNVTIPALSGAAMFVVWNGFGLRPSLGPLFDLGLLVAP